MTSKEMINQLQLIVAGLAGLLIVYCIFYLLNKNNGLGLEGFKKKKKKKARLMPTQNTSSEDEDQDDDSDEPDDITKLIDNMTTENDKLKQYIDEDNIKLINAYKERIQIKTINALAAEQNTDAMLTNLSFQLNSLDDLIAYITSLNKNISTKQSIGGTTAASTNSNIKMLWE